MANTKIRNLVKKYKIQHWKLAELLGVSESTMYRMLRTELPEEKQKNIISVIEAYEGE